MRLSFFGAAETVTGSKYLLENHDQSILVDCGLFQGRKEYRLRNWDAPLFNPAKIDAVVLTHAHIDHSGYLPVLVKKGFKGPIYATPATIDLCEILLRDSGRIHEEDARRANKYGYTKHKPALPLYTEEDAIKALRQFKVLKFGHDLPLGDELTVTASHAGHILGAAILTFRTPDTTLVFSGDLGRLHDPVIRPPATIQTADYLVLESTYGDRLHPDVDPLLELAEVINSTASKGGMVLIPAFAVGRTQKMLYLIHQLFESGAVRQLPVYLDSPMAQNVTDLMKRHTAEHLLPKELCSEVCSIAKYTRTPEESKALNDLKVPSIIIAASGMVEGGRVLHHVKRLAPDPHNTIVFSGFQAPMTRGDRILRGESQVRIHGTDVPIRCRVERLESLSSHADYKEIFSWLDDFRDTPRVFLTHGEVDACHEFKGRIEERYHWEVKVPKYKESIEI